MSDPLPPLVKLADYGNDWEAYLEALYRLYLDEVVNAGITFQGLPLSVQFRPMTHGKGFGFWHLISEGELEEDRLPAMRRCERIRWVAWILRNADLLPDAIIWWENKRQNNTHVVLWFREENFAVVLAKRRDYFLLKSAYDPTPHRAKSFEKEWKQYWKKG